MQLSEEVSARVEFRVFGRPWRIEREEDENDIRLRLYAPGEERCIKISRWKHGESSSFASPIGYPSLPPYASFPKSDLRVLEHVRQTWTPNGKRRLEAALQEVWGTRMPDAPLLAYEPGDYSRAALRVLNSEAP